MNESARSERNGLFMTGGVIMMIGIILSTIFGFFIFLGIPLILFGILLIVCSRKPVKTKILYTVFPLVIVPSFWFIYDHLNKVQPTTYLIPTGYRGVVRILYGEPCGIVPKYENGRRIFFIPPSGVVITQQPLETGYIDHEYYFVDGNGTRTRLYSQLDVREFNEECTTEKNDTRPLRDQLAMVHNAGIAGSMGDVEFEQFMVGTYQEFMVLDSFDFAYNAYNQKFDSVQNSLLYQCREAGK